MIQRYVHNKTTWLEVVSPSSEEIREIVDECDLPLEFAGDLTTMTPRTEVFARKGFFKITLDFPIVRRTDISHPHEIKFIATKTHFITIRFEEIEAVHRFTKEYEVLCMLNSKSKKSTSPNVLFLTLLNHLYVAMHAKLDYLEEKLKDIEEQIFDGNEKEMVFELSQIGRRLISFKRTISAHENALEKLGSSLSTAFGKVTHTKVAEIEHHYRSLNRHLQALSKVHDDMKGTNSALLYTKQNEVMITFTILAFITFPLTLLSSLFGMNTQHTPIVGEKGDFWMIVSVMICISITFFAYFKSKRWI